MLPPEAKGVIAKQILVPKTITAAANASGNYVDVSNAAGDIVVICDVGSVSGSVTGALWTADDTSGTNATTVLFDDGNSFTFVDTTNTIEYKVLDARKCQGTLKYAGTVTALSSIVMSVSVVYKPRITS